MTYQPMRRLIPLAALLCLVLARSALAQNDAKVIATAYVTDLAVNVFTDAADGRMSMDSERAVALQDQYAFSDWNIYDNGVVAIARDNQVLQLANSLSTPDGNYFVFHFRDKGHFVNGTINRNPNDRIHGIAAMFLTTFAADGSSTTAYFSFALTFEQ
jgi:hypothetical protein